MWRLLKLLCPIIKNKARGLRLVATVKSGKERDQAKADEGVILPSQSPLASLFSYQLCNATGDIGPKFTLRWWHSLLKVANQMTGVVAEVTYHERELISEAPWPSILVSVYAMVICTHFRSFWLVDNLLLLSASWLLSFFAIRESSPSGVSPLS